MELTVKTLEGAVFRVAVGAEATGAQLKQQLVPLAGVPASTQRLIFRGKLLSDAQPLASAGVADGSTVHLVKQPPQPQSPQPQPQQATAQQILESVTRMFQQTTTTQEELDAMMDSAMEDLAGAAPQPPRPQQATFPQVFGRIISEFQQAQQSGGGDDAQQPRRLSDMLESVSALLGEQQQQGSSVGPQSKLERLIAAMAESLTVPDAMRLMQGDWASLGRLHAALRAWLIREVGEGEAQLDAFAAEAVAELRESFDDSALPQEVTSRVRPGFVLSDAVLGPVERGIRDVLRIALEDVPEEDGGGDAFARQSGAFAKRFVVELVDSIAAALVGGVADAEVVLRYYLYTFQQQAGQDLAFISSNMLAQRIMQTYHTSKQEQLAAAAAPAAVPAVPEAGTTTLSLLQMPTPETTVAELMRQCSHRCHRPDSCLTSEIEMKRSTSDREAAAKAGMLFPYEELSDAELARRRADGGESSDEETRNTVGDVPEEWYADQAHIGYDREGRRLLKAPGWERRRDAIERFLDAKDDPDHWRRFYDAREDTEHVLSDADLRVVGALLDSRFAAARTLLPGGIDPDWPVAPVDPQEAAMPTGLDALRKRDFAPSKIERKAVWKLAKLIAKGWIKPPSAESSTRRDQDDDVTDFAADAQFDLWATPGAQRPGNLPPPPAELPGHADSYNPPAEYLPTEAEAERLEQQKLPVPRKYKSLRSVPGDSGLLKHMYRRCLELYLRPRMPPLHAKRKAARLDRDQLLAREQAKLPSPEELRPFPTAVAVVYRGHGDGAMVRSVAPDPIAGQWLASGADDGGLRLWEVETGRCVAVAALGEDTPVRCVSWRPLLKQVGEEEEEQEEDEEGRWMPPKQERRFLAVAAGHCVFLVEPHILASDDAEDEGAQSPIESDTDAAPGVSWRRATEDETAAFANFGRIDAVIEHADDVATLSWHHGGDYLLVVTQLDVAQPVRNTAAIVHRVSGHSSRRLHISSKAGPVQTATFDPSGKPHVYIATQRAVRIYNVGAKKKRTKGKRSPLEKKLLPGVRWVSTVAVHPTGRHTIIGSFDKRVCWFESELSSRPFKMMRHHRMAVRRVTFHPLAGTTLPLFASCSDDGRTHIFHAGIPAEDDWNANPLLVPLRVLHGHALHEGYGVLDAAFHPTQPWIFTAGADGTIVLHTDKETAMH